jgi:Conserved TM helix
MFESSTLLASLRDTWARILTVVPDVALALVLLVAGWLLARFLRRLCTRVLRLMRVDELAERAGFEDFLVRGGVDATAVTLIAGAVYWTVLLGVFLALLDALGLRAANLLLERIAGFIPNLVVAVGILVFGSLLARIAGGLVFSYLSNIGTPAAAPVGALARYAVFAFVVFMAAEQLTIRSEVLVSGFQIAFAAVCLAAALAFGLGGRDWAAQVIERYTRK